VLLQNGLYGPWDDIRCLGSNSCVFRNVTTHAAGELSSFQVDAQLVDLSLDESPLHVLSFPKQCLHCRVLTVLVKAPWII